MRMRKDWVNSGQSVAHETVQMFIILWKSCGAFTVSDNYLPGPLSHFR